MQPAARCRSEPRAGQRPAARVQLGERVLPALPVEVERDDPGHAARCRGNHGIRPAPPPRIDRVGIAARILVAMLGERPLAPAGSAERHHREAETLRIPARHPRPPTRPRDHRRRLVARPRCEEVRGGSARGRRTRGPHEPAQQLGFSRAQRRPPSMTMVPGSAGSGAPARRSRHQVTRTSGRSASRSRGCCASNPRSSRAARSSGQAASLLRMVIPQRRGWSSPAPTRATARRPPAETSFARRS